MTVLDGKGAQTLPDRSALMKLAKGRKTTNDYSKAGPSITQNGPSIAGDENE